MTEGGNQERTFVISVASKEAEKALVELTGNHQASFADSSQAREMFQKYGGGGESSSLPEAEPEDRSGGGEPPKPSDSKAGGNEDSDTRCIHSEDKPKPDGWRWKQIKDNEKSTKYAGYYPYDSHDVANHWVNDLEPLYGVSSIRDFFEEADSREELIRRVERLCGIEIYGRRTDEKGDKQE